MHEDQRRCPLITAGKMKRRVARRSDGVLGDGERHDGLLDGWAGHCDFRRTPLTKIPDAPSRMKRALPLIAPADSAVTANRKARDSAAISER
jgi:hypothetical protein